MANKDPVLSFEDFKQSAQDFSAYFLPNFIGGFYRKEKAYKTCAKNHPQFAVLSAELQEMTDTKSQRYLCKLYSAYRLMRQYAEGDAEIARSQLPTR